ncbi:MAG TPA: NAD(P)H-dependent oxidoreductase subunit E [Spirochaetota bacterium]|nr:NAD(P)H-dependent oxidoreductase subunit E [Spirochaetota bacterium]HOD15523.1 NAD(P)H-dependent oxidoreductase subunit E [Spirochaetota bacterium]HPG51311.1 NAD(P)H-dependent oxidoreductase subunit E [Spirochaetota bacterium]HPN11963.1 NAD(P)H-dependent oxidoreductase subunit E [Spirochaetota bacterium]HQL82258.1 NAD(P)H-dependent oxidoreductase subunit E [Spirochaetota bacterium]
MSNAGDSVAKVVKKHGKNASMMLDIIREVQDDIGCVSDEAAAGIANSLGVSKVDVDGVISFYHFLSKKPLGKYTVYLNNSAVAIMKGRDAVAKAFEQAVGCSFGETSFDGQIGLYDTSDIGMNDQEPAALINGVVFTSLTPEKAKDLVFQMKAGKDVKAMVREVGDGMNKSDIIHAMVKNNIQKEGPVIFAPFESGSGIRKAVAMTPEQVIEEIKKSNLRGRGGAGFPTGMKWEFTRNAKGKHAYVLCNADEGEPGTFKDRVILTERPEMLFEGMAVAGYAIGASEGVLYLRAEYRYLLDYLNDILTAMRKNGLLGKSAAGKKGFDFDISIKLGAGAYICGEESALIESAEGKRGEPRNRPPFPAQYGYKGQPTAVNNVESLCAAARIMEKGGEWFAKMGTFQSHGVKVLSISGDCTRPGIYEVEFGMTLEKLLEECGGSGAVAVQVGGPSGKCVGKKDFGKKLSFEELPTGGSMIVIGPDRDLLGIVHNFMDFFVEESCGWCTPCRAGNVILKQRLEKVMAGKGTESDLADMASWCGIVKAMSRCGLGQTSPNPIATTLENFREVYEAKLQKGVDFVSEFDMSTAVRDYCVTAGRKAEVKGH